MPLYRYETGTETRKSSMNAFKCVTVNSCEHGKNIYARIQSRDRGSGPRPEKIKKNIGFPSNTGRDPLKDIQQSMLGHHYHASETKLRFAGEPLMARF